MMHLQLIEEMNLDRRIWRLWIGIEGQQVVKSCLITELSYYQCMHVLGWWQYRAPCRLWYQLIRVVFGFWYLMLSVAFGHTLLLLLQFLAYSCYCFAIRCHFSPTTFSLFYKEQQTVRQMSCQLRTNLQPCRSTSTSYRMVRGLIYGSSIFFMDQYFVIFNSKLQLPHTTSSCT